MFEKYIDSVLKAGLFKGIEKKSALAMMDCLKPRVCTYKKNEFIATAGETFKGVGIVVRGEAAVIKENAAGDRTIITVLKEGGIFGEMAAFSKLNVWPATVQAQDNCTILFIPAQKIVGECSNVCPWHQLLINNFVGIVSDKALMLNKKVEYLTIKSIRGKIGTYLLEQYNEQCRKTGSKTIKLPLNRNELADFLNISRPSMSREMCKMRDEGIIDFHLAEFTILDAEALKDMSGE